VRRSPLYYPLKEKGAVYGAKYGWERVNWFAPEGVEEKTSTPSRHAQLDGARGAEHKAAREHVVLIDQSSFCKFEVKGPVPWRF
jgi:sarcosine dehydrogenase